MAYSFQPELFLCVTIETLRKRLNRGLSKIRSPLQFRFLCPNNWTELYTRNKTWEHTDTVRFWLTQGDEGGSLVPWKVGTESQNSNKWTGEGIFWMEASGINVCPAIRVGYLDTATRTKYSVPEPNGNFWANAWARCRSWHHMDSLALLLQRIRFPFA